MNTKKIQSGVLNLGSYYEELVPAYFALKLLKDQDVKDFRLTLNPSSYAKFDDLVAEIEHKDGTENIAIQLKHREPQKEVLDVKEFWQKGKPFEIVQYKNAYDKLDSQIQKNYKLILFTNAKFVNIDSSQIYDVEQTRTTFKTSLFNMINTLQFREKGSTKRILFYKNFFLFSEQKNCYSLREEIIKQFCDNFHCDRRYAEYYVLFFGDLRKAFYDNTEINKKALMMKIIDLLLSDYIVYSPLENKESNMIAYLIKQALRNFDITICYHLPETNFSLQDISKHHDKTSLHKIMELSKKNKIILKDYLEVEGNNFYKLSSYFSEGILFVKVNHKSKQTIISVINLCNNVESFYTKFVLIVEENILEKSVIMSKSIFKNLAQLKQLDKFLYDTITENFKVSLQGRTSTNLLLLQTIYDLSLDEFITPSILFQSLHSDFNIGTRIEPVTRHYIERTLSRSAVSYLENLCVKSFVEKQMCAIYYSDDQFFKSYLKRNNFRWKIVYAKEENMLKTPTLCLLDKEKCIDKSCTYSKFSKNDDLDWKMFDISLNNKQLFSHNLNVIYGNPGSGNTTIMKYLANNCSLKYWVVYVPLKEYYVTIENEEIEFGIEDFLKSDDIVSHQVIRHMKENKHIMFFVEDLDKLSNANAIKVAKEIEDLSKRGYVCWISCSKRLENTLKEVIIADNVLYNEDLELEEIELFVTENISNKTISETDIRFICTKIFNSREFEQNVLKVPIFLRILTTLINKAENVKTFCDCLNIAEIYTSFVSKQIERKLSDNIYNLNKTFLYLYFVECQIGALKNCLEAEDFTILNIKNRRKFLEKIKNLGDPIDLILEINSDDLFVFIHHSLAEYFAAVWFEDNMKDIPYEKRRFIFKPQYKKILHFLNLLLAQNCPLHLAICNRDFERVVEIAESHLNDLDNAGRNPLHIASSLGMTHLSLSTNLSKHNFKNETKIFQYLLSKMENDYIIKKDKFFEMNCFQFADAALSLSFLEELSKKGELQFSYLHNYKNLNTLSEAYVKFGYVTVLNKVFEWKKLEDLESKDMPFLHLALYHGQEEVALFSIEQQITFNKSNCFERNLLHVATYSNCKKVVQKLLNLGVDTETTDMKGKTPLHLAAEKGYKDIVECLIISGAKIDAKNKNNRTALHEASFLGEIEVVRFLIEKGANVNSSDVNQETPILSATISGQFETVKCLIENGANIQAFDKIQRTVLHYAVIKNDLSFVKYLIEMDVNVFACDTNGQTPIQLAKKHNYKSIVEVLKKAKKDKERQENQIDIFESVRKGILQNIQYFDGIVEETNKYNETILHVAARERHEEIVEILLNKSANTSARNHEGEIPLHLAAKHGHLKIVQLLLNEEVMNTTDKWGLTPLHLAAEKGDKEIVQFLTEKGAQLLPSKSAGETPLHSAICCGHTHIVQYFVSKNIDIRTKNETYLHFAAKFGGTDIVYVLLQKWQKFVNEIDEVGRTPLHWAVELKRFFVTHFFIRFGADVHIKDFSGKTPLDIAKTTKRDDILDIVSKNGVLTHVDLFED